MSDKPKTVSMESIAHHTFDGKERPVGSTYEAEEHYVETLAALQFARRADVKAHKPDPPAKPKK